MEGDKHCVRCGAYLRNYMVDNYYSLIRKKYCDACSTAARMEFNRLNVKAFRKRNREIRQRKDAQLEMLKVENELLRKKIKDLQN